MGQKQTNSERRIAFRQGDTNEPSLFGCPLLLFMSIVHPIDGVILIVCLWSQTACETENPKANNRE